MAEKIVVFGSFDNVIKANIVKTKLDAYGIPCFLTDEHFVNLYPIQNDLFPGVRLHIFAKDRDAVTELLKEEPVSAGESLQCPYCRSKNVHLEVTQQGKLLRIAVALSFGLLFPAKEVYQCRDCAREF